MTSTDAFEFAFEMPTYYNRQHKLDIIHHYCVEKYRKTVGDEKLSMMVFKHEIEAMFKRKPVIIIDDYITENNINLHYHAKKILDRSNAVELINTMNDDTKTKLNDLYSECDSNDDYIPLFEAYYKEFTSSS